MLKYIGLNLPYNVKTITMWHDRLNYHSSYHNAKYKYIKSAGCTQIYIMEYPDFISTIKVIIKITKHEKKYLHVPYFQGEKLGNNIWFHNDSFLIW